MSDWRLLDHTADLALEGWGSSPEAALAALCRGLLTQLVGEGAVFPRDARTLEVEGVDTTDVAVSTLGELLYLVQVQGWLPGRVEVALLGEHQSVLVMMGEPLDPERHQLSQEIKAATFHDFALEQGDDGLYHLKVIFDV